jgi:RIO kinase 1
MSIEHDLSPEPFPYGEPEDDASADGFAPDERWTTWDTASHGPEPRPDWVLTELSAVDTDLGILKTGKEADVFLVERATPERGCLLAAKRYRSAEHRMFHRDAGYLEGRRVRRSREMRAMRRRTDFGRELIAGQWAHAEFAALSRLWTLSRERGGIRVPYPVSLDDAELLLEFVGGEDGVAAPRLAQARPAPSGLESLWQQTVSGLETLAEAGLAHGDLSPYNLLVHGGELVFIDLPQVVDIVANPQGPQFLRRDVQTMCTWFTARGLDRAVADPEQVLGSLLGLAWS